MNGEPDVVVGVPLIVTVLPFTEEFTPVGKPVTVAPVAPPPSVYVIVPIAVFAQTDCVVLPDAGVSVGSGLTVMVPVKLTVPQLPPEVTTVKLNGDPADVVGVPLMVNVLPLMFEVTPAGKPLTVAVVAPPPNV